MFNRMGPQVSASNATRSFPSQLAVHAADVVLIDAKACAALGSVSTTWWHESVRAGRAPQPVVRRTRCTRWRMVDVIKFWRDFAESGDAGTAAELVARATKASAVAKAKRAAQAEVA